MALFEQVSAAVSTLLGAFNIPATEIRKMAASVTQAIYCHCCVWVLARDIFNNQEEFQLNVGQKKGHFAIQKQLQPVPDITQHTPKELNETEIT